MLKQKHTPKHKVAKPRVAKQHTKKVVRKIQKRKNATTTTTTANTSVDDKKKKKSSSTIPESELSPELLSWVKQPTAPRGMYGTVDNSLLFNLGSTINAPADSTSWVYNLNSGAHPAAHWITAPFSIPTSDLAADGYHDPVLTPPPKPFTARMWGGGEITWRRPLLMGTPVLQVASVDSPPVVKRTRANGDIAMSTYTNRW
eukprot:UN04300